MKKRISGVLPTVTFDAKIRENEIDNEKRHEDSSTKKCLKDLDLKM